MTDNQKCQYNILVYWGMHSSMFRICIELSAQNRIDIIFMPQSTIYIN